MKIFALYLIVPFILSGYYVASADEKHSAVKPEPRSGGWVKRHESFNERVAKGNVDLILIGDSITHGWEGQGKKIWEQYYTKRNAVNLGIGGDRTQHVIWRLDNGNIKGISPKAAVVMIGTNNSGNNTPQEIADGLKVITKQLREKLPKTKVLLFHKKDLYISQRNLNLFFLQQEVFQI